MIEIPRQIINHSVDDYHPFNGRFASLGVKNKPINRLTSNRNKFRSTDEINQMCFFISSSRSLPLSRTRIFISPAMEKIGYLWETKKLGIEQEHLATDTIKTALARIVVHFPRQKEKNIKVLLACAEGETHDLGLQALAYELELGGYSIHYLGASTPFKALINSVKTVKPDYIFISACVPSISDEDLISGIKKLAKTSKGINAKLLAGGEYFKRFDKNTIRCDMIANSIKESISFIKKSIKQIHKQKKGSKS